MGIIPSASSSGSCRKICVPFASLLLTQSHNWPQSHLLEVFFVLALQSSWTCSSGLATMICSHLVYGQAVKTGVWGVCGATHCASLQIQFVYVVWKHGFPSGNKGWYIEWWWMGVHMQTRELFSKKIDRALGALNIWSCISVIASFFLDKIYPTQHWCGKNSVLQESMLQVVKVSW